MGWDLLSFLVVQRDQTLQWVQGNPSLNLNEIKIKQYSLCDINGNFHKIIPLRHAELCSTNTMGKQHSQLDRPLHHLPCHQRDRLNPA